MESEFSRAYYEPHSSPLMKFLFKKPIKKSAITKSSVAATLVAIFSVTMGVILLRTTTNAVPSAHASSAPSLPMPKYTPPVPAPKSVSSSKKGTPGQAMMRLQKRVAKTSSSSSVTSSRRSSVSSSSRSRASSSAKKRPVRKPVFKKMSTKKA